MRVWKLNPLENELNFLLWNQTGIFENSRSKWPCENNVQGFFLFVKGRAAKFLVPPIFNSYITQRVFNTKYEKYLNP